ncbi:MAG: ABC transporter permease, partial [Burkholderiales bacterium PBB5]
MLAFVLRRLFQALIVLLTVAFIAFMLFQFVGDPVTNLMGQDATVEQRAQLRADLGLDQPFVVQFARFIGNAVQGEFGISLRQGRKVSALIADRFPATLELAIVAAFLGLLMGVPLGVIGPLTFGLLTLDGIRHRILPAFTLALFPMALVLRLVRAEMLEVLRTDYIKFARARGLPNRLVYFGHALKNTLVPVITIAGLQLGGIIAFAIVTETVFQWPGMGLLFISAVQFADIPVMAAYLCL